MQKVIEIKRVTDKTPYFFLDSTNSEVGDRVVVNFDEFQTIATVTKTDINLDSSKQSELLKVIRKATESDLKKFDELSKKAKKELKSIKKLSLNLGLMMKFVSAEYSLDNSKIIITFSSEERVDFRQFLKELASMLKTRIELKQIGQRDEVKILDGVGPCGQQCCCSRFLKDFDHVTVKMAKVQGLSLSPTKINGVCGRLMCCLGYESSTYEEVLSRMPKINSEVTSPNGKGIVVYNDILRERVSIKRQAEGDTFVVEDFSLEEIIFGEKRQERQEHNQEPKHDKKTSENKQQMKSGEQKNSQNYQKNAEKINKNNENSQIIAENELEVQMLGGEKPLNQGAKNVKKFGFKKNKKFNSNKNK